MKNWNVPWGAVATLTGEGFSRAALIVFQFVAANLLGVERYGSLGLMLSAAAVLLPLADAGLLNLALRYLANNRDPRAFSLLLGLKLLATALYLGSVIAVAVIAPSGPGLAFALVAAGAYWALTSLADFIRQCLRARELSLAEFRARMIHPLLFLPSLLLMFLFTPDVMGTLILWCIPGAGVLVAYAWPLRRIFSPLRPQLAGARSLVVGQGKFLAHSAGYLFLATLSGRLDLWLIEARMDRVSVGVYFAAYSMVFSGLFFGQALSAHMYPRLHRLDATPSDGLRILLRAFSAHLGLAIAALVAVIVVGGQVYDLVFRARGFSDGGVLLPYMGVLLGVSILNYLWLSVLIGLDKQWVASAMFLLIIPVKILLGLAWIPAGGAEGMLKAALCAEVPTAVLMAVIASGLYLRRHS